MKINTPKYSTPNNISFDATEKTFDIKERSKKYGKNTSFIKQQIHEKKIDEFFWTDTNAPKKRQSPIVALGSILGVIAPIIYIGKKHNPNLKIDGLKSVGKLLNIHYDVKAILAVGLGGATGGLLGGLLDRKERNKLDKIEEASFQFMNISFPALLIDRVIKLCEKNPKLNKSYIKLPASAVALIVGAGSAVKVSNHLDDKFFDKYNKDEERKFKKKDLLVHFDDLVGALVLAKVPFAGKLHAEKILPAIFAWSGYHVGEA